MFALIGALCFAAGAACFEGWIDAHWMFWLLAGKSKSHIPQPTTRAPLGYSPSTQPAHPSA